MATGTAYSGFRRWLVGLHLTTGHVGDEYWTVAGVYARYFVDPTYFGVWVYFLLDL